MTRNNNGVIRDTTVTIDFIRTARTQAPSENEIIQSMLHDYEEIPSVIGYGKAGYSHCVI